MLIGRDTQIQELTGLLKEAAQERGGALVLRGEAGIGKTALLQDTVTQAAASGMRVVTVTGVQAEVRIPYAGLHQILRPMRIGMNPDDETSPFRIAVELLELLGAVDEPVLLAVEDAHWIDRSSWDALAFLGRRLESDRIALVMTTRDGDDVDQRLTAAGLPEIRLEPLGPETSAELLDRVVPGLQPALRQRVLDEAAGNPLGLVELGGAAARSGAGALLPAALPLSTRVERTFAALVAELPPTTRALLLTAALDDGDELDEIVAATGRAEGRPVTALDVEPAVATRLVTVDAQYRLRFRHPLLRSALRQAARAGDRRRTHAALAEVLTGAPARRLWHRAAAATGPDEILAGELTEVALRAEGRTVAVEVAALERAAQLSEDAGQRNTRLVFAVAMAHDQGDPQTVRRLLAQVDVDVLPAAERARLTWVQEFYQGGGWSGSSRLHAYLDLIDTMRQAGETEWALYSLNDVYLRLHWSNPDEDLRRRFVKVVESVVTAPGDHRPLTFIATAAPIERGAACLIRLEGMRLRVDANPAEQYGLGVAASALGAFDLSTVFITNAIVHLRAQGRLGRLSAALVTLGFNAVGTGDTRAALTASREGMALAAEVGYQSWVLTARLNLGAAEALRGGSAAAQEIADFCESALTAVGMHPMLALVQRIRGLDALARGRPDDAFGQLLRVFDPGDTAHHPYVRFLLVGALAEAALLAGRPDDLRPVVDEMEPLADLSRSPALIAGLVYARAVLADSADGYAEALRADLAAWPFERARLGLAYGSWLRRRRRAADSRPHLRAAAATFDALGAAPWADRARAELRASGESQRRPSDAADQLTPQELQIAGMAADGLSNKEIAEQLFLSPRTVTTHLYRIYPKIGVKSRGELARALRIRTDATEAS